MHPGLTRIFKKHPVHLIIAASVIVRFGFLLVSNHLYYPDEIFQTLEPAFAHISGFGIEAWEYEAGIRPLFVPLLLSLPLKVFYMVSRGDPQVYTLLMKLFLSTWSIVIPLAVFQVVKKSHADARRANHYALLSGLLTGVWFELIYVAPRALYETLALNLIASAYLVYTRAATHKEKSLSKEFGYAFCASLVALTGATRPQFLVVFPIGLLWFFNQNTWAKNRLLFGGLLTVLAIGAHEYSQTGFFMHSFLRYIELQLTTPISDIFGVQSWLYYPKALLATSGALFIPAIITLKKKVSRSWWLALIVLVISHSALPHKELRFILPIVPIVMILFGQSLDLWHQTAKRFTKYLPEVLTGAALLMSILSLLYVFPWSKEYYTVPFLYRDSLLKTANVLHEDSSVCGIYDESRTWPISLSYYLINRNVPLYNQDYPPPNLDVISHQLTQVGDSIAVSVKQPATCATDPAYTNKRSFPAIQSIVEEYQFSSVK